MMRGLVNRAWLGLGAALLLACGGKAVIDASGSGGSGGNSASSSNAMSSSASGPSGCMDHQDCNSGEVCLFGTGECVPACGEFCESCGPGSICNGCATSSCPACADCLAACVPIGAGQCDPDDPCTGPNEVCFWESGTCLQSCGANGTCSEPNTSCNGCLTGSCCGCDDCVDACLPI